MNKRLIIGFLLGMLVSGIAFAVNNNSIETFNLNKNVRIEVDKVSKQIVTGRIMVRVDGKWHRFQNQVYTLKVK